MSVGAVGLKTHIWNNNLKSFALVACFPLLFYILLWVFFGASNLFSGTQVFDMERFNGAGMAGIKQYWLLVLGGVGVWFVIAFLFNQSMINAATGAKPVTREEQPKIYNMLENLCISRGIITPKLYIIDSEALNAYASGINNSNYAITLTAGIIASLNDDELEAVIGHELTHIINRDVRLLIVCVIFVGIFSFLAEFAFRSMRFRGGGRSKKAGPQILIAAVLLAVGYFLASLIRFAISRKREFLADAGAVELTKKPEAMISALMKISGKAKIEGVPDEVEQMFIENPPSVFSLFSTHPKIEERVKALKMIGRIDDSQLSAISEGLNNSQEQDSPWEDRSKKIW